MMFVEVLVKFRFRGFIMWFSKFFGPSPRKQRLTVYRGLQVMSARVMASNIRAKLYVNLRWLFDDISGLMCSFDFSSFVNLDMVSLLPWVAAGSSRKSI